MERLTLGRAIRSIVLIALVLVAAGGALARLVEPETFTSIGLGAMLMLTGLSLIPLITSVAVSVLAAKRALAARDEELALHAEQAERLAHIEQQLAALGARPSAADASPPSAPAGELPPRG